MITEREGERAHIAYAIYDVLCGYSSIRSSFDGGSLFDVARKCAAAISFLEAAPSGTPELAALPPSPDAGAPEDGERKSGRRSTADQVLWVSEHAPKDITAWQALKDGYPALTIGELRAALASRPRDAGVVAAQEQNARPGESNVGAGANVLGAAPATPASRPTPEPEREDVVRLPSSPDAPGGEPTPEMIEEGLHAWDDATTDYLGEKNDFDEKSVAARDGYRRPLVATIQRIALRAAVPALPVIPASAVLLTAWEGELDGVKHRGGSLGYTKIPSYATGRYDIRASAVTVKGEAPTDGARDDE